MMENRNIRLDPGIYLNMFPVHIPEEAMSLMVAKRSLFPDLRLLRQKLGQEGMQAWVYAVRDNIYGYGPDASKLKDEGFQERSLELKKEPQLSVHLIMEGLLTKLREEKFEVLRRKGRWIVYESPPFSEAVNGAVRVYRGYDLRVFYWSSGSDQFAFGLIVDIDWALRDREGKPLNLQEIRERYGYNAIIAIGQIQGEYLPDSARINTEAARHRLKEHILPFVQKHSNFDLPCGGKAYLSPEPVRVVLGGDER